MNTLKIKTHVTLLVMSFVTWGFFVLLGLPDYYQSWSYDAKILICIGVTLLYVPLAPLLLKRLFDEREEYFRNSIWLAFYLTVPLFTYDVIYISWIGEEDLSFVSRYWYLTFFYFSFWVQFPLIGLLMEKEKTA